MSRTSKGKTALAPIHRLKLPYETHRLAYSRDGRLLQSTSETVETHVVDVRTGEALAGKTMKAGLDAMMAFAQGLMADPAAMAAIMQAALWHYYERIVVKVYRAQMDPKDAALQTPHIDAPTDVWRLVSRPTLRISDYGKTLDLRLVGGCKWDDEHGIDIPLDAAGKPRRR